MHMRASPFTGEPEGPKITTLALLDDDQLEWHAARTLIKLRNVDALTGDDTAPVS